MKQCLLIFAINLAAAAAIASSDHVENHPFNAGQTLTVDLRPGGNVVVIGEDRDDLQLSYSEEARERGFDLQATQNGQGLVLNGRLEKRLKRFSLTLTIRMPTVANLNLDSSGGNLKISDIQGHLDVGTKGGNVVLRRLQGDIKLKTMGGNISIEDSTLDGSVKTMGGNISLAATQGLVDCETMGGNISLDNQGTIALAGNENPLRVKTMGGNISVGSAPNGIHADTYGGNISVKESGPAQVETKGGNITFGELDGSINAHTHGGSITVTMVGDPDDGNRDVELSSNGGDIRLTLPSGFSGDFDIQIEQSRRAKRDYQIKSDIPLNIETAGTSPKRIRATGQSLTGKHRVRIHTSNGDVILKTAR